jgi:putative ABC transport system ATP-binding protein
MTSQGGRHQQNVPSSAAKGPPGLFVAVLRHTYVATKEGPMLLTVTDLRKTYATADGPFDVLRGIDMTLDRGETLALTGESGSGKSTLLHLIGGLDAPDGGQIMLDGEDLTAMDDNGRARMRRDTVGVVFQQFNLIPSLRIADNIAFQARLAGRHDPAWCATLADRMGLTPQLRKYPEQLSGGQQQRVAIARTLAPRPKLVLADEPTGNLDEATAAQVLTLMLDLVADTGAGLLMVTHSDRLAGQMMRRLHLAQGQIA